MLLKWYAEPLPKLLLSLLLALTVPELRRVAGMASASSSSSSAAAAAAKKMVSEFASRPFIRRVLARSGNSSSTADKSPRSPHDVLTFFFGVDYNAGDDAIDVGLRQGRCLEEIGPLWYGGGPDYDELCRNFVGEIRMAGRRAREIVEDPVWSKTVDGMVAQVVLCDQFSRNAFRGEPEAFAYDGTSQEIARTLKDLVLRKGDGSPQLAGEFYPAYYCPVTLAFMHSERIEDHDAAARLLEHAKATAPAHLRKHWDTQLQYEHDHRKVLDRFGRYPHRNKAKGRESTPEELEWLSDEDNLPGWAKSQ